jgi:uncharacterized protein (TIGR03067 family)
MLEGSWTFESVQSGGSVMPREMTAAARITLTGERFVSEGMGAPYEGTLILDAGTSPRSLDMVITAGHAAGTRHLGIYEIDGARWTMCLAPAGANRPARFSSTASNGCVLQTLQRGRTEKPAGVTPRTPSSRRQAAGAPHAAGSASSTELEGEWAMVSGVFNGAVMSESMVKWCTRVTQADVTTVLAGPRVMLRARFSLDTTKQPWTIDYLNLEGSDRGKAQHGIAELDGDALRICMAPPGGARPNAFASSKGDKRSYTTWRRA